MWKSCDKYKKEGVSYLHRTAQPITFAYFRTWRVLGSWSYKTYPGTKVNKLFNPANVFKDKIAVLNELILQYFLKACHGLFIIFAPL